MPNPYNISGLSGAEVERSRLEHGANVMSQKKSGGFLDILRRTATDPMVILLAAASGVYLLTGQYSDAIFLASAIVLVASISLFQYARSHRALEKLTEFSRPLCRVIRNDEIAMINSSELVVGDCLIVDESMLIAADGTLIRANDLTVNESILTGESLSVAKDPLADASVFAGTTVATGTGVLRVVSVGNATKLGKIGKSLQEIGEQKTPLETQISNFVKYMALVGIVVFALVWLLNFIRTGSWLSSLLQALTLAMSILPEEIPVAFTTFMALGAFRLMNTGIVVKQMKIVETLGSATVICTDKTGTITQNRMTLAKLYDFGADAITEPSEVGAMPMELLEAAMWSSEPVPIDPMEIAIHHAYQSGAPKDKRPEFRMVFEYPLEGRPPMMTHVFQSEYQRIIAAKGAPEAILAVSDLSPEALARTTAALDGFARQGFRVLGVAVSSFGGENFPQDQRDLPWKFLGLVAFHDPPKENIAHVLDEFYSAGIQVKIITGDNAATTGAIASQVGFRGADSNITGEDLMHMDDSDFARAVDSHSIFTRMFPEAKLRIVNALKKAGHVVAMTGDGVNDGPALKAAHIGVAMGQKGTAIAKDAASLILAEDDLSKMVDAIAMGRKIYANLKKAIQYIISIHIPIVMVVFIPLAAGWIYPNIFSPIHVIFLELVMGPTCSIIYENEPLEKDAMRRKPRTMTATFFNWRELWVSIAQGLAITAGLLVVYQLYSDLGESFTRTMVFTTLVAANILLTLVNRSFYHSVIYTLRYRNALLTGIVFVTLALLALMLFVTPVAAFFGFVPISLPEIAICFGVAAVSVIWIEIPKWFRRRVVAGG